MTKSMKPVAGRKEARGRQAGEKMSVTATCRIVLRFALGFMATLSASLAIANAEGTGAHRPTAPHSLHVVSDDNYPPYLFRNADGEVEGYLVDL